MHFYCIFIASSFSSPLTYDFSSPLVNYMTLNGNIDGLLHYHNFDFIHYSTFGKEYDMSSKTAKSHDNSEACDNW